MHIMTIQRDDGAEPSEQPLPGAPPAPFVVGAVYAPPKSTEASKVRGGPLGIDVRSKDHDAALSGDAQCS